MRVENDARRLNLAIAYQLEAEDFATHGRRVMGYDDAWASRLQRHADDCYRAARRITIGDMP